MSVKVGLPWQNQVRVTCYPNCSQINFRKGIGHYLSPGGGEGGSGGFSRDHMVLKITEGGIIQNF